MLIAASSSSLSDFPWPGFLLLATFILMVAIFRSVRRARAGAIGKVARNLGLEPMPDASVLDLHSTRSIPPVSAESRTSFEGPPAGSS